MTGWYSDDHGLRSDTNAPVALVTGAGSDPGATGIGAAIAVRLSRGGARVVVVDIDLRRAQVTAERILEEGADALAFEADVTDGSSAAAAVQAAVSRWGRLDSLVNSVGITGGPGTLESLNLDSWDRVLATNLRAAVIMCGHALPHLLRSGEASVVNVASVSGLRASGNVAYGPSKAALIQLTSELAVMYGRRGIRANAVAPGHLFTPMLGPLSDQERQRRRRIAPLGVEGDAWDVAGVVAFLTSRESRFVSGVCIPVDGGVTAIAALTASRLLEEP